MAFDLGYRARRRMRRTRKRTPPAVVTHIVARIVEGVHERRSVHGNLREASFIAPSVDLGRVMLVGFNWGRIREDFLSQATRSLHGGELAARKHTVDRMITTSRNTTFAFS